METLIDDYFPVAIESVNEPASASLKASQLLAGLQQGVLAHCELVSYQRGQGMDVIIFDIQPEIPQRPLHDIRPVERIACLFIDGEDLPDTLLLRRDFPDVPHLFYFRANQAKLVCLTEESEAEQRRNWTPVRYAQLLHRWLRLTARGELHDPEQPLEPVLLASANRIILPALFYEKRVSLDSSKLQLNVYETGKTGDQTTYLAELDSARSWRTEGKLAQFTSFIYSAPPRPQASSRYRPGNVAELAELLGREVFMAALRAYLREMADQHSDKLASPVLFFIRLPKTRLESGPIETVENWVFVTATKGRELGKKVGLWEDQDGYLARLLTPDTTKMGQDVGLDLLNPLPALTPQRAALLNKAAFDGAETFLGIGVGALGSQLITNLFRSGMAHWTLIDEDILLPHNLARHHLPGLCVGTPKAESMATLLNSIYEVNTVMAVVADVLTKPLVDWTSSPPTAVVDTSASVAVGRHLALDETVDARRMSVFLNPAGTDLVVLTESSGRQYRLDGLEMDYYQALIQQSDLSKHLFVDGKPIRYSYACRDVSTQLSQDQVALFSGIGSRAVRQVLAQPEPLIKIWRSEPDLSVRTYCIAPTFYQTISVGSWTLLVSERVTSCLRQQRLKRLPNETGGVLIGAFDLERQLIYVVDTIASPPDSQEWPTAYIRGVEGLPDQLSRIGQITANQLMYVGEWHAHPRHCPTTPSADDRTLFEWLRLERQQDGLPPLMAIAGDRAISWYVERL